MENNEKAYYEKVDIDNELKLRKQLAALPPYCKQYFIAICTGRIEGWNINGKQ
jgi:hypothetical protein